MQLLCIIGELKNLIFKILISLNKFNFLNNSYEDAKMLVLNYLGVDHPLVNQIQAATNNIKNRSNKK